MNADLFCAYKNIWRELASVSSFEFRLCQNSVWNFCCLCTNIKKHYTSLSKVPLHFKSITQLIYEYIVMIFYTFLDMSFVIKTKNL